MPARVFIGPRIHYFYPGTYSYYAPYGGFGYGWQQQGYRDGFDLGRYDAYHGWGYDPWRHGRYRHAISVSYRDGFVSGYDAGYRQYAG